MREIAKQAERIDDSDMLAILAKEIHSAVKVSRPIKQVIDLTWLPRKKRN